MLILKAGDLVLKPSTVLGTAKENCYLLENYYVQIQHVVFINNYAGKKIGILVLLKCMSIRQALQCISFPNSFSKFNKT